MHVNNASIGRSLSAAGKESRARMRWHAAEASAGDNRWGWKWGWGWGMGDGGWRCDVMCKIVKPKSTTGLGRSLLSRNVYRWGTRLEAFDAAEKWVGEGPPEDEVECDCQMRCGCGLVEFPSSCGCPLPSWVRVLRASPTNWPKPRRPCRSCCPCCPCCNTNAISGRGTPVPTCAACQA
jgi:hypothetical protein